MKATEVTAGLAEINGSLLLGIWRDSLHVTCGLTACTPGSAPGPTLGNEYGKTLPFLHRHGFRPGWANIFLEKIRRQAQIFLSLLTLVFSLPTLDLIKWVRPSCDYLNKSLLKSSLLPPLSLSRSAYPLRMRLSV